MALVLDAAERDKSLAFGVELAVKELNRAISAAHDAGLRVEIDSPVTHQNIGERWPRQLIQSKVTRLVEGA